MCSSNKKRRVGKEREEGASFTALINLFDALDIKEKGIEKVYDYLLKNNIIDDIKRVAEELGFSQKRMYKIFSALKEHELVQIYDRPMKVMVQPPIPAWEKLISQKIEQYRIELEEKIRICQSSFEKMRQAYNLDTEIEEIPPVEFIPYTQDTEISDYLSNNFEGEREVLIARTIKHQNPFLEKIYQIIPKKGKEKREEDLKYCKEFFQELKAFFDSVKVQTYKVLLTEDYLEDVNELISEFEISKEKVEYEINFIQTFLNSRAEIRIIDQPFGNFIIKDRSELLQFSVDPSNYLQGIFISRQKEIIDIFMDKFNNVFSLGKEFASYVKEKDEMESTLIKLFATFL